MNTSWYRYKSGISTRIHLSVRIITGGLLVLLLLFAFCCTKRSLTEKTRGVVGQHAMVVTAHPLATEVGLAVLENGGNAVDAAIAVQFALAVVYPAAGNIGGGGFMVIRDHNRQYTALDYRETAPGAASENMYLDKDGSVIPDLSTRGILACGVPGTIRGMDMAYERFGSRPWADLVDPAIKLADEGFLLTPGEAAGLNAEQAVIREINGDYGGFITSRNWRPGDTIRIKDLAGVLRRIRDRGADDFYEGRTADLIVEAMARRGGMITGEDLRNYRAVWREPVSVRYKGYRVTSMPPPSSGGIALIQLLKMIEPFPVKKWGRYDARTVHLMSEIEKLVYADRAVFLGDQDYHPVPVKSLISDAYIETRLEQFNPDKALDAGEISAGDPVFESDQTTHFSIVDPMGNAVAVTTTLNGAYGSKVLVEGGGFFLNNEMDDFSIKPGHPNMFGLIGGKANSIAPGKRMLSSMTPTILEKDGQLYMVLGSPGGSTIITSVFQVILNVVDFGMTMQQAVAACRHHHQWRPDQIKAENGAFSDELIRQLESIGHTIEMVKSMGRVDAILVDRRADILEGGADPRGDDTAMGY